MKGKPMYYIFHFLIYHCTTYYLVFERNFEFVDRPDEHLSFFWRLTSLGVLSMPRITSTGRNKTGLFSRNSPLFHLLLRPKKLLSNETKEYFELGLTMCSNKVTAKLNLTIKFYTNITCV